MHRIEVLWSLSGTQMKIFCVPMLLLDVDPVNHRTSIFFTGQTTDRQQRQPIA